MRCGSTARRWSKRVAGILHPVRSCSFTASTTSLGRLTSASRASAAAARALAVVGDTEHEPALVALLDDDDEAVRVAAARALTGLRRRLDG